MNKQKMEALLECFVVNFFNKLPQNVANVSFKNKIHVS